MKKNISVILCIVMMLSVCSVAAAAIEKDEETPVILVTGFLQTYLYTEEEGEERGLWLPEIKDILANLKGGTLPELLASVFGFFLGDPEKTGDTVGKLIGNFLEDLRCLPDGSSALPVKHYENDPAIRNIASLGKDGNENKLNSYSMYFDYLCENGYANAENLFTFEYDGRDDAITNAEKLRDFIKAVKEYTGKSKVTLLGISFGGQIIETYLHYYRNELDVKKAILCVPALNGTDFISRLLLGNIELSLDDTIDFFENILCSDLEVYNLAKGVEPEKLNKALNAASVYIAENVKYWSSIYSLSSTECYEELKETFLDTEESAAIIENNEIIHYEIMPAIEETLKDCQNLGIDVAMTVCSGIEPCFGGNSSSDFLLDVDDTTGAYCTVIGERFADGYKAKGTNCSDSAHNHISPKMDIDASTAYLPENTWFIEGAYHANFPFEDYRMELMAKLTCTDELKDVHSDSAFPQFVCTDSPHKGIYGEFDSSTSGYISSEDTAFVVENKYITDSPVKILEITAKGMDIAFPEDIDITLKPGETAEIPFTGDVPEVNATRAEITVSFLKLNDGIIYSRDFDITINNGTSEAPAEETTEDEHFNGKNTSPFSETKKLILNFIYPLKIVIYVLGLLNPFAK